MAKENRDTGRKKPKAEREPTPFERFDRLARRIVQVPKEEARKLDKKRKR